MKIIFMGTPPFAATTLAALYHAGHTILAVYSQPPRPAGRGYKLEASAVQTWAEQHNLRIETPLSLKKPEVLEALARYAPDVIVVAAYGLILPQAVLDLPQYGCLNIHASLLPRWRGAAPVHRALLAGDEETGVTIMQMDAGLDTGAILAKASLAITAEHNAQNLTHDLAVLGGDLIVSTLQQLSDLVAIPQLETGVTYAHKISKDDMRIDWQRPATDILLQIQTFSPKPGAYFIYQTETFKVLQAAFVTQHCSAGETIDDALTVACGQQAIRIEVIQRQGKHPMPTADFLRGYPIPKGTRLAV